MASVAESSWWGFRLRLSHSETCYVIQGGGIAISLVLKFVPAPYNALAALAIGANMAWIASKNRASGKKGVLLRINWLGVLMGIKRRGAGFSPC